MSKITGKIFVRNLHALSDVSNNPTKMCYEATVLLENQPIRTMQFKRMDSAHTFINLYLEENNENDA